LVVCLGCFSYSIERVAAADGAEAKRTMLRSAKSGPWSDPATWEGSRIPAAGDRVQIRTGHRVGYDVSPGDVIRFAHVAGTLTFAPDKSTLLNVGLVLVQPGETASETGFDCDAHL